MSQATAYEALEPGHPRDPDSTIRILKAFYKMGDLDAMKQYIVLWNLAAAKKTKVQEKEAQDLVDLIAGMEMFEKEHGQGSCLQLEHHSVCNLIAKDFYPSHVLANARSARWKPTAYLDWEYPRLPRTNSVTSLKCSNIVTSAATSL